MSENNREISNIEANNKDENKSKDVESINNQNLVEENAVPHKRRVRYSGTHPKKFNEKYKELNPEKYGDTVAKVISKGSTPAGMHISIMVKEILDFLKIHPGQKGLDATLGYGGHTSKMLERLKNNQDGKYSESEIAKGHLYGLDVDPIEIVKTTKRLADKGFGPEIVTTINTNFANIDEVAKEYGTFDFMLADLGVSSMQIDNPERGFSYKINGPLDLRLNPEKGVSAAEKLKEITRDEFEWMLVENSDEPCAAAIAKEVFELARKGQSVETTKDLYNAVESALKKTSEYKKSSEREFKEAVKKTCQRTFQALRIDVNSEFEVLELFLSKLPDVLSSGGRVAILTFHSGEDRMVKKAFKQMKKAGIYSEISEDVIRPSAEECNVNPRARSTKMRWAVKA